MKKNILMIALLLSCVGLWAGNQSAPLPTVLEPQTTLIVVSGGRESVTYNDTGISIKCGNNENVVCYMFNPGTGQIWLPSMNGGDDEMYTFSEYEQSPDGIEIWF